MLYKLTIALLFLLMVNVTTAKSTQTRSIIYKTSILGLAGGALSNAEARLNLNKKSLGKLTTYKVKTLYQQSSNVIQEAIKPYGYFRAIVTPELQHYKRSYRAIFKVEPGNPIRVMHLKIDLKGAGKNNPALNAAIKNSLLQKGMALNIPAYRTAKATLIRTAKAEGYIFANFSQDTSNINLITYQVTTHLTLNTGKRYYFGPFTFTQKTPLNSAFLRRFIHIKTGEPFNEKRLFKLQSDYDAGGYFKTANVVPKYPKPSSKKTAIPVNINLVMHKKHLYQMGGGFGTDSGPRVTLATTGRWATASGNRYKASTILSKTYYQLTAQYLIPGHDPANSNYTLNAGIFILEPPNAGKAFVRKFGPGYLVKRGLWTFTANLNYYMERWRLNDTANYTSSHLLQPYLEINKISTDNIVLVENGYTFSVIITAANKSILSSLTYVQPQLKFKWITTLGHDNRFIFSTQLGATFSKHKNNLPLSQRFFAGGQGSMLGFEFQGIGPGYNVAVANAEYQRRIKGPFYSGLFYNVGNAYNGKFSDYKNNLQRSAGLSLVWRSPVGDLSLYWAKVLSMPGQPSRFGFTLGPEL